ncbi:MAG: Cytidine and deoxycytidylate deaminase zinc-binding region [candidate division CPR1 bacterium GW2011_GWA2_42_17]|uniref:Cytidine and deoxycytidylate deaminase zinc-binding region n=1 Tax=candidate division CPR1 bacterium GW2011_GWA2_42_17 TaxID=1618341 RepID=A0A0G1BBF6_9BACT|nr:MAG: Cytidine and deoxycytidylate deaminase zinc-binding region [candidate division CPR1 bacterium GW2011_GWA2_42_17]
MNDKKYLQLAIEQAKKSVDEGGFPAGAIIVKDGKIIAKGISVGFKNNDPTGHAETSAIRTACQNLKTRDLSGAVLYGSLECCNMCFSVAYWAGISKIVYACRKTPEMVEKFYYEGTTDNKLINKSNNKKTELVFIPDFEKEAIALVKSWEEKQK